MNNEDCAWYHIPGYNGYDINKNTMKIRSFKNYKKDPYHIMTVDKYGKVTVSNDVKGRTHITPQALYDLTFNSGAKLEPALDGIYMSGRQRMSKEQGYEIQMDFSKYIKK